MFDPEEDDAQDKDDHGDGVSLEKPHVLGRMLLETLWGIKIQPAVNDQVDRNQGEKHSLVLNKFAPVASLKEERLEKGAHEADIIAETKSRINDQTIQNDMQPVQISLIFLYHERASLISAVWLI